MSVQLAAPLEERLRPQPVELDLQALEEAIGAAEDELRLGRSRIEIVAAATSPRWSG